ncbi:response regulator transcription factor [Desulfofundulus thermosubterraneus]|uniref:Stage 0 sporulation protein A homolog n=1 Tax=Desulfofundulus thermosubterraneus DSM 16057 TaxID=1121432 RepID=A0A1M6DXH4_9FIRM|nr:response regulator [Desulfofundulus thermosubterraneus]SHI77853.1 two-component system, response regulator YesN [Desulfofundulus thermosubterraneus DSM 16057]
MNNANEMSLLVVDDEHLERQAIRLILERAEEPIKVVGEARNGRQAVQMAEELRPDIILLDIKMPGMDGLTAAREIRKILPASAIIFLTAYNEFDYVQEALRIGVCDFLLKPIRTQELVDVLRNTRLQLLRERQEQSEHKRLQEQLTEALPWLRVNLGLGLIWGLWEDRAAVEQQARLVRLEVLPRVAFGVCMESRLEGNTASLTRFELLRYQLQRLVEEVLNRHPWGLCLPISDRILIGLWGNQGPDQEQNLRQLANDIIETAADQLSLGVTVGLSRFCEDISQLPHAAWEAQTAAHLGMFYLGPERVVHVDELEHKNGKDEIVYAARERELIEVLRSGDAEKVRKVFREFLVSIFDGRGTDLHLIKARLMTVLVAFSRSMGSYGDLKEEMVHAYNKFARQLSLCLSVEEMENWLVELALTGNGCSGEHGGKLVTGAVKRALAYIHENYQREISLTDLSRIIFLSPDYFSRAFKEQVGCTFSEYVMRLRIEKAKKLLAETDLPVGEVAQQVGYPDPNYFSRVFGRAMGVPPSRYRQMITARRGG